MLLSAVLTVVLSVTPGDGLGLSTGPDRPESPPAAIPGAPAAPAPPAPPIGVAVVAAAALAVAARLRAAASVPRGSPLVVFVAGHGNGSAPGTFADLVGLMGLDPSDARYFDYRWATSQADPKAASQDAPIDDVVDALTGFLAGVAAEGRQVYVVGFSKGGAAVAQMLAEWDATPEVAIPGVAGAALLEPPIAKGLHGDLQSAGRHVGFIPDDGGYDPVVCTTAGLVCRDTRENLGKSAGVAVTVVRNPKAGITTFGDHPEGLRVFEDSDVGPDFWEVLVSKPWALPDRVSQAHESVLHSQDVADCLVAEMGEPGTCDLPVFGRQPGWAIPNVPGTRGGILGTNLVV